ncbi:MAG: hypothetical protein GIW99_11940 [Candidatus Eremiobacteraeota bacterium]|nr:hypothetical protein [Candidatus Eremiobacteraeota bacterium]MBC5828371.1 hypothetical protein [Candidatus Eremiobacteraeota bacterium]
MSDAPQQSTGFDDRVRLAVYRSFVKTAQPPHPDELARQVNATPEQVRASYGRLADAHVLVVQPQSPFVRMEMPFSAVVTDYEVLDGSTRYHANCAWDAFGVVAVLGRDATVRCRCADCGERVAFRIEHNKLEPGDGLIHFVVPAHRWWDDIIFT